MKRLRIALCTAVVIAMAGCEKTQKKVVEGMAMGTTYRVVCYTNGEIPQMSIDSIFTAFENSCSIYLPSSLISRINRNETDTIDGNIRECLEVAGKVWEASDGYYDVTIKPLIEAYGFYSNYRHGEVNKDSLRQIVGFEKIYIEGNRLVKKDPRMQIDLNSLAKGYAVDLVSRWMVQQGYEDFLVELGGEVCCRGTNDGQGWKVGIDRPTQGNFNPGADMSMILTLSDAAIATSGNYRNFYYDDQGVIINHTFNPITLETEVNDMASVTVMAPTMVYADAYATAVMALGFENGRRMIEADPSLAALFIYYDDGELKTYMTKQM